MKPQFVPVILGGRRGATPFTPARLFTSGVTGAWYDPSDYSTLFQDSAGTTPVTAVEQPVRLMLDKSQGLVLGSELVITPYSGSVTGGWGFSGNTVTRDGVTVGGVCNLNISARSSATSRCQITFTVSGLSGDTFSMQSGTGNVGSISTNGPKSFIFDTTSTTTLRFIAWGGGAGSVVISNISVKEIAGNHALAPNDASRPVLRARYNLLTYSEQFDNAVWAKRSVGTVTTVTSNTTTAPDGTLTADTIADVSASDYAQIDNGASTAGIANTNYTFSIYVLKDAVTSRFPEFLLFDNTNNLGVCVQLNTSTGAVANRTVIGSPTYTTTIQDAGLWWRLIHTMRTGGTTTTLTSFIRPAMSSTLGGAVDSSITGSIVIWGAQLITGSSAGTYQRIAAATDYATAGFLPYLYFVTDDSFGTNSIDFTATDKMSVCAGVTKLSDAAAQIVCELSATSSAGNNGSFAIISALSPSNYAFYLYGNALASRTATTYASPVTNVVSVKYDISQSTVPNEIAPQINGAVPTLADAGGAGTGNFGNYPLYIGRRNNASLPFNGNLYQLIVCGKTLSASELASTEAYVNSKTGAY